MELHKEEFVTKTIEDQVGAPDRHIYSITEAGKQALQQWILSEPEPPQTKKPFLNQLLWADSLTPQEMDAQLEAYLNAVGEKLFFLRVQADEKKNMPERTPREQYLWHMVYKNWIDQFELELSWIRQMRQELQWVRSK